MLTIDMKESRDGIVDMKNVTADSVEKCIQFMYHGEVDLRQIGDVKNVLYAADRMQLDLLTELCFDHLKQNMSVENIFFIKDLAETFHYESVYEICNTHMAKHFQEVSKQDGFASLKYEELLGYVRNLAVDKDLMWQAIVRWMDRKKQRKENLLELLKNFHDIHSDMYFILTVVSRNHSVRKSPQCTEYILNILLSDVEAAKKSVTLESCYAMYYIIRNCERERTSILTKSLKSFMADNFEEISQAQEWVNIVADDIITILQDGKLTYSLETIKWDAALKWVKHVSQRKENFPELLRSLDFDALSDEFIQKNIRKEPLVAESAACMGIVLDAVMNKAGKKLQTDLTAFVTSHENETNRTSSNSDSPLRSFASENPEIRQLKIADIGIRGESLVEQDLHRDGASQSPCTPTTRPPSST